MSPTSAIEFKSKIQISFPHSIYLPNTYVISAIKYTKKVFELNWNKKEQKKNTFQFQIMGIRVVNLKFMSHKKKYNIFSYNQKLQCRNRYMQTCDLKKKQFRLQSKKKKKFK